MRTLDVTTLLIALVLNQVVLAAALAFAAGRRGERSVAPWAGSLLVQAISFALFASRGTVAALPSIIGVNALAALGFSLQYQALCEFFRRPAPRWWWHASLAVALVALASVLAANLRARIGSAGLAYSVIMFALGTATRRFDVGTQRLGTRLVFCGYLLGSLMMAIRAVTAAVRPEAYLGFHGLGTMPVVSSFGAQIVTLTTSLGFLLMHRERQERAMEHLAMTDALTGAFNRRTLFDLGQKALADARAKSTSFSVIILDVDHFKRINDGHGHQVGDAVLLQLVEVLRPCLRKTDLLTRYGGEEFCIVLPDSNLDAATHVAEKIRGAIEAHAFRFHGQSLRVTSSAGVAAMISTETDTLEVLVRRADQALYAAKRDGRNRVVTAAAA